MISKAYTKKEKHGWKVVGNGPIVSITLKQHGAKDTAVKRNTHTRGFVYEVEKYLYKTIKFIIIIIYLRWV